MSHVSAAMTIRSNFITAFFFLLTWIKAITGRIIVGGTPRVGISLKRNLIIGFMLMSLAISRH